MNRTLRNGLAVAGMAGGFLLLGQAVASADTDASQTVTPTAEANNLSLGSGGGAVATNNTTAINIAAQVDATTVSTNVNTGPAISVNQNSGSNNVQAYGGSGTVNTNTGNAASIAVSTGDVNGSGNISGDAVKAATSGGGNVTATQTVTPKATANNASASLPSLPVLAAQGSGGGAYASNDTLAINAAIDVDLTSLSTNVNTGPDIYVSQYSGDNDVKCLALSCRVNAQTGNAVDIEVETGDINNSGNIGVSHKGHGHDGHKGDRHHGDKHADHKKGYHRDDDCPEHKKAAPAPTKRTVATVTYRSAAQPTGKLASTGAETSAPLALGLLALGAGGALTLAGRRRSSSTTA
ncbi:hypothetical protein [Blastococcus sp. CCUG 61487]|uniref:hypothetical protein n=1 Tax=Blastococcus sp. CCUG 61487 TaxID=1840703 RepID=UPI0010C0935B|nr:hypothetical protein [Blastococcus sp. CCUG 61487]TKJ30640.1 hypothetical protein A6V29_18780 [Blastococcus sp. CCUG 61487]